MSEKNETDQSNVQDTGKDRVGDIIRKERITRRITVETIAKDLKLNVKYIKSLKPVNTRLASRPVYSCLLSISRKIFVT